MGIKFKLLEGGYCTHKEKMIIQGGRNKTVKIPSMFGLIIHNKHGVILYDTGYTERFYKETSSFPFNIYAKLTPVYVKEEDTAVSKLKQLNIFPEDVKYIIISHFHADHVSALRDFPKAKFICMKDGYDNIKGLNTFNALKAGFLSGLLPDDFEKRLIFLDMEKDEFKINPVQPFEYTFDYFGDGTIKFIPLIGHYKGHLGILLQDDLKNDFFLIADSCWLSMSYRENILPHKMANLIMDNPNEYKNTLGKIHKFYIDNQNVNIIPSHCSEAYEKFSKKKI